MEHIDFGSRLKIVRRYRQWSQTQLGVLLHCHQTRISGLERNRYALHFEEMNLAAQALGFSLDVFRQSGDFDLTACLLPDYKGVPPPAQA